MSGRKFGHPKRKASEKYKNIKLPAAAVMLIAALFMAVYYFSGGFIPDFSGDGIEVHFIDVGQGDAALIRSAEGNILVDSGPGGSSDVFTAYVKNHVDAIDYMILTHPHEDHIGGADNILDELPVKNVIMPDVSSETNTFSRLLDAVERNGTNVIKAVNGDVYNVGQMKLTLLAPNSDTYIETNDYSIVMHLEYGNFSVMFTGDAEKISEDEILSLYSPPSLKSTVLKAGHHGSSTSSSEDFLNAVMPEIAVISCGRDNDYGHPHSDILKRLDAVGAEICRTDKDGTIIVSTDGNTYKVKKSIGE